uniref:X8 domain-containing protein n=1 Tax=Oryza meridionalis TaxID=40149 RepID=A0A0E0D279_9ORYZ
MREAGMQARCTRSIQCADPTVEPSTLPCQNRTTTPDDLSARRPVSRDPLHRAQPSLCLLLYPHTTTPVRAESSELSSSPAASACLQLRWVRQPSPPSRALQQLRYGPTQLLFLRAVIVCFLLIRPAVMESAAAAALVLAVLLLSSTLAASDFCVCRSEQPTAVLQKAIDYSCGQGADCTSILSSGGCYNPNTVAAHCSWAANSYFQKFRASGATCDFGGAATLSSSDPSFSGCTFPSSASAAGTTGLSPGVGTGTGTLSPGVGTGTGTNGTGMGSALSPPGTSNFDGAAAAAGLLLRAEPAIFFTVLLLSFLALP